MNKVCLVCGTVYTKKITRSLRSWKTSKYCSHQCADKYRIGKPNTSSTKFVKGDERCIGNTNAKGHIPWNKGKAWDEETKRKLSQALAGKPTGRTGEKCHFWKGGKTNGRKLLQNSIEYKNWRRKVFERDDFTCQECGDRNYIGRGKTVELHPHHIKPVSKFPELTCELSNGITLCKKCHRLTDSWGRPKI